MDDWNKIPMPTEEEKEQAIAHILEVGLPVRPNLRSVLRQTAQFVNLKMLFFGVEDCLFLAVLLLFVGLMPTAVASVQQGALPTALFLLSPAMYACLHLLTAWKENQFGTLEWKQTCKVSFRGLITLRMLVFGGMSVIVCVSTNVLLWVLAHGAFSLPWMLALSFSSLFLYGALSMACLRLHGLVSLLAAPIAWIALGLVLLLWERAAGWLAAVPTIEFSLMATVGLAMYVMELRRFCLRQSEGGYTYALG